MEQIIHYADWAAQPDVHIACLDKWTSPVFGYIGTEILEVWKSDGDLLYCFNRDLVTCEKCQFWITAREMRIG